MPNSKKDRISSQPEAYMNCIGFIHGTDQVRGNSYSRT